MSIIPPDIEIYIRSVSPEAIKVWLQNITSSLEVKSFSPKRQSYWATFADDPQEFEILALNKVEDNFSSVWFNTKSSPWAHDNICAQQAFQHFQSAVRCVASGWQEGDATDLWLHIDSDGEQTIDWL
tara:strand:+ start:449 stop:829 length:381 start_codon:yes stop_codon:yes gene_type:complete